MKKQTKCKLGAALGLFSLGTVNANINCIKLFGIPITKEYRVNLQAVRNKIKQTNLMIVCAFTVQRGSKFKGMYTSIGKERKRQKYYAAYLSLSLLYEERIIYD